MNDVNSTESQPNYIMSSNKVHRERGRGSGEEREKKELRMDVGVMPGNCLNYDIVNIIANYKLGVI